MSQVRVADLEDVPLLVALMTEFYAEADYPLAAEAAARTFTQLLGDPRLGRVWILEYDSVAAGYVVLTVCFSMEYGGLHGFLDDLFVRKAHRGRGLAGAALAAVRRNAEKLGLRAVHVEVGPENEVALRAYRRSGFEDSGRLLLTLPLEPPVHAA